jgi:hypothetical protein
VTVQELIGELLTESLPYPDAVEVLVEVSGTQEQIKSIAVESNEGVIRIVINGRAEEILA